ncbi:MAG: TonB-dependent receptor, partial [Chitinophagaceae bacterium]|nr:TonB-dependent receptor [Chitinophagaceae bacterium]
NYFKYEVEGRWTEDNKDASKPRSYEREEPYWRSQYPTSYNYQKNGYVRLKNITLSYNLPGTLLNRIMLKRAQLFLSGNNVLLLYSQNKIQDPETDNMQTYPIMKTYSLGVQIGF